MEKLLELRDLRTYYFLRRGVLRAVDGINFALGKGEIVGLIGESGSGKSATALSIMRLIGPPGRIVGGSIMFKGTNLMNLAEEEMRKVRGKNISIIFQDPMTYLNPVYRIKDQLREVIHVHNSLDREAEDELTIKNLELVGIPAPESVMNYYPHQLSGGMRQRILIAGAISCNPDIIIADEPTTALDVTVQAQILDLLKSLKARLGLSILLITHDMGLVADMCDRVYVMYAGKIVESADVFRLFRNPSHPYTRGLVESVIAMSGLNRNVTGIEGSIPNMLSPPPGCRFNPRCKRAMAKCSKDVPLPISIEENHDVACFLYEKEGVN